MISRLIVSATVLALTPVAATAQDDPRAEAIAAADAFFAALRSPDKAALAEVMLPDAMIYVHDRIVPDQPRVDAIRVSDHLARWAKGTRAVDERMTYATVLVDGDMAQVWGPYVFLVDDKVSHCGINSLSLVRTDAGWKVGNTSFSMVAPDQCTAIGAPEAGQ
jgi:ketosteroid isomerase-like protein